MPVTAPGREQNPGSRTLNDRNQPAADIGVEKVRIAAVGDVQAPAARVQIRHEADIDRRAMNPQSPPRLPLPDVLRQYHRRSDHAVREEGLDGGVVLELEADGYPYSSNRDTLLGPVISSDDLDNEEAPAR